MTPGIVPSNSYTRCFQYKLLDNALFLNKKLFKKSNSLLYSFWKKEDETVFHVYFYCPNVRNLWNQLMFYLPEDLTFPEDVTYRFDFHIKPCRLQPLAFPKKTICKT